MPPAGGSDALQHARSFGKLSPCGACRSSPRDCVRGAEVQALPGSNPALRPRRSPWFSAQSGCLRSPWASMPAGAAATRGAGWRAQLRQAAGLSALDCREPRKPFPPHPMMEHPPPVSAFTCANRPVGEAADDRKRFWKCSTARASRCMTCCMSLCCRTSARGGSAPERASWPAMVRLGDQPRGLCRESCRRAQMPGGFCRAAGSGGRAWEGVTRAAYTEIGTPNVLQRPGGPNYSSHTALECWGCLQWTPRVPSLRIGGLVAPARSREWVSYKLADSPWGALLFRRAMRGGASSAAKMQNRHFARPHELPPALHGPGCAAERVGAPARPSEKRPGPGLEWARVAGRAARVRAARPVQFNLIQVVVARRRRRLQPPRRREGPCRPPLSWTPSGLLALLILGDCRASRVHFHQLAVKANVVQGQAI